MKTHRHKVCVEREDYMKWQPIDTAPTTGIFYLVTDGNNYSVENQPPGCFPGIWQKSGTEWYGSSNRHFEPTHWRPLPKLGGAQRRKL